MSMQMSWDSNVLVLFADTLGLRMMIDLQLRAIQVFGRNTELRMIAKISRPLSNDGSELSRWFRLELHDVSWIMNNDE